MQGLPIRYGVDIGDPTVPTHVSQQAVIDVANTGVTGLVADIRTIEPMVVTARDDIEGAARLGISVREYQEREAAALAKVAEQNTMARSIVRGKQRAAVEGAHAHARLYASPQGLAALFSLGHKPKATTEPAQGS